MNGYDYELTLIGANQETENSRFTASRQSSETELLQAIYDELKRLGDILELRASQVGEAPKTCYSVREAAQVLGKSEPTVRRWIREGKLESTKSSENQQGQHMIPRSSLQKYVQGGW
jgi:excisionase family DNA binding protein